MLIRHFFRIKRCIPIRKNRTIKNLAFIFRRFIPFFGETIPILDEVFTKKINSRSKRSTICIPDNTSHMDVTVYFCEIFLKTL